MFSLHTKSAKLVQTGSSLPPGSDPQFKALIFYSAYICYDSTNEMQHFFEEMNAYIHNSKENCVSRLISLFKLVQATCQLILQ
jgi:hypothetical protein